MQFGYVVRIEFKGYVCVAAVYHFLQARRVEFLQSVPASVVGNASDTGIKAQRTASVEGGCQTFVTLIICCGASALQSSHVVAQDVCM